MKTFPVLLKSMNDRVRPSDELLEDTKAKMRAAIQTTEAPTKKRPVFRYSTALAGLALVIAGASFLPRLTNDLPGLPYSGNRTPSGGNSSGLIYGRPHDGEESQGTEKPGGTQTKPNSSGSKSAPPNAVVQPPLYPPLPPDSSGKDSEQQSEPNILSDDNRSDSKLQYPTLFYSKRLPTLSEIALAGDSSTAASSSAPTGEPSSVPSSPSDAPVQSSGMEPPSGAGIVPGSSHDAPPDASGTSDQGAEPSVPSLSELTDGVTAPVVTVGDSTLYFQPISSMTVSSWTITDPENVEEKQWTTEDVVA